MVEYEKLRDVIVEAIEECGSHRLCEGCRYEHVDTPCHCTAMLIVDNILKHYNISEKGEK